MEKVCLKCGKTFTKKRNTSKKEWTTCKFCSHSCANSTNSLGNKYSCGKIPWNKGKIMPRGKDNKRYTSISKFCEICGKEFIVRNYRRDTATCCSRKCSYARRDYGLSSESQKIRHCKEYAKWRELVFEKDDWTCQKCFSRSGCGKAIVLNAHHIYNFSEKETIRFNPDNGITFCKKCHYDFHSKYGFTGNNNAQIHNFISAVGVQA